jgi:hypothetical protein
MSDFENILTSQYISQATSPTFSNLNLISLIPQLVRQAIEQGTSQMLRQLKSQL